MKIINTVLKVGTDYSRIENPKLSAMRSGFTLDKKNCNFKQQKIIVNETTHIKALIILDSFVGEDLFIGQGLFNSIHIHKLYDILKELVVSKIEVSDRIFQIVEQALYEQINNKSITITKPIYKDLHDNDFLNLTLKIANLKNKKI